MSEEIVKVEQQMIAELRQSESMRAYLRTGDLSTLPEPEQDKILVKMCAHYGLDPVLRPFCIIPAQNKKIWYATKAATDMVAARDGLTRKFKERRIDKELMICEIIMEITDGTRIEEGTAVVSLGEFARDPKSGQITERMMAGEALANAIMRCETKAKRRATLAWFGMPDGTGGEDIEVVSSPAATLPAAKPVQPTATEVIDSDPLPNLPNLPAEEAPTPATEAQAPAGKKRGRPSRAEIEAKAMQSQAPAESPAQPAPAAEAERIHFADQVAAAGNLAPAPAAELPIEAPAVTSPAHTAPAVTPAPGMLAKDGNGQTVGITKPFWLRQKETNPHFNADFDPATAGRLVGEPEEEFLARTGKVKPTIGQAVAEQVWAEDKASKAAIVQLVRYSREVDAHKAFMKSTLEQCGIDWKNPEHIKIATKVSVAAHGVAPIQDGAAFLAAEFQAWVSAELKKHTMPMVDEIPL